MPGPINTGSPLFGNASDSCYTNLYKNLISQFRLASQKLRFLTFCFQNLLPKNFATQPASIEFCSKARSRRSANTTSMPYFIFFYFIFQMHIYFHLASKKPFIWTFKSSNYCPSSAFFESPWFTLGNFDANYKV